MSVDSPLARDGAALLARRAAAAEQRADARLAAAIADFFLPDEDRLDDRTRAAVAALFEATVGAVEREIAAHAARLLDSRGAAALAARLAGNGSVLDRLVESGLARDAELMDELIAQARVALIDEALVANRAPGTAPTLLARLTEVADGVIRNRAIAYLVADGRRRLPAADRCAELPAELFHRIGWWIAAALRERLGEDAPAADRALAEATQRSLAAHDEGERVEAAAAHLAAAIDALPHERAPLLLDTLAEGRVALFVAILTHALGVDGAETRALVLDAGGERLWLALRSLGMERDAIARIGWTLCEADRARDVETLADRIDPVAALTPEAAALALAPLALNRDFRAAVRALARAS
jgi:hypothetical protein